MTEKNRNVELFANLFNHPRDEVSKQKEFIFPFHCDDSGGVNYSCCLPVGVQMQGENAPSQLILYHYPDLKDEKGVVLMTAELDPKFIVSPLPAWNHT